MPKKDPNQSFFELKIHKIRNYASSIQNETRRPIFPGKWSIYSYESHGNLR